MANFFLRDTALTYVTVDWDYFIPEDPMWDFGHRESQFHLRHAWAIRILHFKEMRTNGLEKDFWPKLWQKFDIPVQDFIRVSDSHSSVCNDPWFWEARTVVLIDAHHDMFGDGKSGRVDCGDWLSAWLRCHKSNRAFWVRADHTWEKDLPSYPGMKALSRRVEGLP